MLKKIFTIALLLCALPALANAGKLTTWVKSQGGEIDSVVMQNQRVINGSLAKLSFTNASTCYVTPDSGFKISKIERNGLVQAVATPNTGYSTRFTPSAGNQSLYATFARISYALTASAGANGTVNTSGYNPVYAGLQNPVKTFIFAPNAGFAVAAVSATAGTIDVDYQFLNATTGLPVTLPAATDVKVKVVVANVPGASIAFSATFSGSSTAPPGPVDPALSVAGNGRAQCANCHFSQGVGGNIYYNWSSSIHGKSTHSLCYQCHAGANTGSHPGNVNLGTVNGSSFVVTDANGVTAGISPSTIVQGNIFCTACHKGGYAPHPFTPLSQTCSVCHAGGGDAHQVKDPTTVTFSLVSSDCITCHTGLGGQGVNISGVTAPHQNQTGNCTNCHTAVSTHRPTAVAGSIDDKHIGGVPSYMGGANGALDNASAGWPAAQTGYLTRGAICADCHNSTNSVIAGFAEGAHGEISNDPMNPFVHYDWSKQTNNGTRQNSNCDRCHTTYGFLKFANMTTGYQRLRDAIANKGTYNATMANYGANNVLMCITCHSSIETGELRTNAAPSGNNGSGTGAGQPLTSGYFALFSSAASGITAGNTKIQVQFPGFKNSSICIPCHAGRSTDQVFIQTIAKAKAVNKNYSTVSTSYYQHGKNIAQTFIGKGAYDFSGKLSTVLANGHANVKMGVNDDQGPCVGCHYSSGDNTSHSLAPTGYATCTACHMSGFGQANVDAAKVNFQAGVKVLDNLIRMQFNPLRVNQSLDLSTERVNVRFGRFLKASGTPADDQTATKAYGAWYNWQILETYDAAAYAHNPAYARQILIDTIDYLDDGIMNGSALATIAAQQTAGSITVADATNAVAFTKDLGCSGCHSATNDPFSGSPIIATYNGSGHSNNSHGPTCASCHAPSNSVVHPTGANPETSMLDGYSASGAGGQCLGCHNGVYSRQFDGVTHFTNATTATFRNVSAAYVGYKGKGINVCATCHFKFDPHTIGAANVTEFQKNSDVLAAWAESGHGERSAAPWVPGTSHDWRNSGSTLNFQTSIPAIDCVRCHTAAGFSQFVDSSYTNVNNVGAADGQRFNSPLACSACHVTDASGSVVENRKPAAQVTTFYNISTVDKVTKLTVKAHVAATYPNTGESNICYPCHSARVSGTALVQAFNNGLSMNNTGFQNSHYMGAAGLMYMKAGFVNFTAASGTLNTPNGNVANYAKTLQPDNVSTPGGISGGVTSTHRKLGTTAVNGDTHVGISGAGWAVAGVLDTNGPCVTCHMKGYGSPSLPGNRAGKGHSLEIDQETITQVCNNCHASEGGNSITTIADFKQHFLEPQSAVFQNALTLAKTTLLNNYGIKYDSSVYPYFYDMWKDPTGKTAVSDWTRAQGGHTAIATAAAQKLHGACFNINLLSREPGAYAHARTYARRLIYDTIDFLDDGRINLSVGSTALAADPVTYGKGATAYTDGTLVTLAPGTTESMVYIIGWSRTNGSWSTPERP